MIYPEEIVNLFKKHDYWTVSLWLFVAACISLVVGLVFADWSALVNAIWSSVSIFSIYMLCMEKEEHESTKEKWADTQDDLCISKHEVERLTLELETTQAALLEAKKPKMHYSGYVQTGFAQVESSAIATTIDVATTEAPLPKPKRKPAPRGTRKPKTKNENKN